MVSPPKRTKLLFSRCFHLQRIKKAQTRVLLKEERSDDDNNNDDEHSSFAHRSKAQKRTLLLSLPLSPPQQSTNIMRRRRIEDFDENTGVLISIEKFCSFFALFCKNFFRTKKTRKTFTQERELLSVYTKILMVRRERTTTHSWYSFSLARVVLS